MLRLRVVFNNVPHRAGLTTAWGFACWVATPGKTVLFDTGSSGDILLATMDELGLEPGQVAAVVLSHIHGDHCGGLSAFLARNADVTVYVPASFPASFRQEVVAAGAAVETVAGPRTLFPGVHSTGEMGWSVREQALIVDCEAGLVLITGCAHPDVAEFAVRARSYRNRPLHLVMGGFHLGGKSESAVAATIARLETLGVRKVAPSHCTGDRAIRMFREAWGEDFVEGGLGAVIELPTGRAADSL